jgi:hypothetical protein
VLSGQASDSVLSWHSSRALKGAGEHDTLPRTEWLPAVVVGVTAASGLLWWGAGRVLSALRGA